jgi:hypothetical protein
VSLNGDVLIAEQNKILFNVEENTDRSFEENIAREMGLCWMAQKPKHPELF